MDILVVAQQDFSHQSIAHFGFSHKYRVNLTKRELASNPNRKHYRKPQ